MNAHSQKTTASFDLHAYPSHLNRSVEVSGNARICLRPARHPMETLSLNTRPDPERFGKFARFQGNANGLPEAVSQQITCIDAAHQMGFVVTTRTDGHDTVVADACFALTEDNDVAEFAVAVAAEWRGRGVGAQLLDAVVCAARHIGVQRLRTEVPSSNRAMVALMLRCGFSIRPHPADERLVRVERSVAPPTSTSRFARRTAHLLDTFRHALPQWSMPVRCAC